MPERVYIGRIKGAKGDKGDPGDKGDKGDRGEQGLQGIQGPPGDPAVVDPADLAEQLASLSVAYTHTQSIPSATWIINHSLPYQPAVTVVDSSGTVVEGDVQYLSPTQIRLVFSGGFSGLAYLT